MPDATPSIRTAILSVNNLIVLRLRRCDAWHGTGRSTYELLGVLGVLSVMVEKRLPSFTNCSAQYTTCQQRASCREIRSSCCRPPPEAIPTGELRKPGSHTNHLNRAA